VTLAADSIALEPATKDVRRDRLVADLPDAAAERVEKYFGCTRRCSSTRLR
jgi:hypothetical protein